MGILCYLSHLFLFSKSLLFLTIPLKVFELFDIGQVEIFKNFIFNLSYKFIILFKKKRPVNKGLKLFFKRGFSLTGGQYPKSIGCLRVNYVICQMPITNFIIS
jgi:hypothetical protein